MLLYLLTKKKKCVSCYKRQKKSLLQPHLAAVSNTISISRLLLSSSPSPTDITRALAYAQFPFAGHALIQTRVVSNRYITVSLQTSNKCASYLTIKKGYIVHLSRTEVEMVNVPLNFSDTSYCTLSCIYWRSLCIRKCYYRYKVKWPACALRTNRWRLH